MYIDSIDKSKVVAQIDRIKTKDPDLVKEFEEKKIKTEFANTGPFPEVIAVEGPAVDTSVSSDLQERQLEAIAMANFRPVLVIRNNQIVPEFVGPDVAIWKERLMERKAILNGVIPAVGRIEVTNNAIYKWVGTGWLVDTDIIVTNRHVASLFCKNNEGFEFKVGFPSGLQSANMDFLEEYQQTNSLEFVIESVLWIAENDTEQPDVAFMRVKQLPGGPSLPKPIPLAESVNEGEVVVTIGYPARDPDVPDQELVLKTFGTVYDKKRLAPGEVTKVNDVELEHDCSTLGGNSGSPVVSLANGEAVGLHFAGLYLQSNFAVPAPKVRELLNKVREGTLQGMRKKETSITPKAINKISTSSIMNNTAPNTYTLEANIPIKITLEVGGLIMPGLSQGFTPYITSASFPPASGVDIYEQALELAKQTLSGLLGIISVGRGYRFRRGWITDERVIVVKVQEKLTFPALKEAGKQLIPQQFLGIGVDVRTAGLHDQLDFLGLDTGMLEAVPTAGVYREPPDLKLERITDQVMKAIFHVSPDSGWPNFRDFLGRVQNRLTATMYEWEAEHISDALFEAVRSGRLKMVTQRTGTRQAVTNMKSRLGNRFEHVWASVGAGKIVPRAYHIKVASRDGKEFWLSSGNWKNSGQPDIDPAGDDSTAITPLRDKNREWHVIIENEQLAELFQKYIEWDFQEAIRVPVDEAIEPQPIFLFVPEAAFNIGLERRGMGRYFDPLEINRVLDIEPLLTPDRNNRGDRMFLDVATKLIDSAQLTIDIENQSFSLLEENAPQYERFFTVLRRKQDSGIPVRIIFRDPREFSGDEQDLQSQLDQLKEFGLNTDNMKAQIGCHTKAIIIDSEDDNNAAVLFGSHNLTNTGALYNRDASLLIRDGEVAHYFQEIFNFDWEVLATQSAEEAVGGIRIAGADEETPLGFRKISLAEFMRES